MTGIKVTSDHLDEPTPHSPPFPQVIPLTKLLFAKKNLIKPLYPWKPFETTENPEKTHFPLRNQSLRIYSIFEIYWKTLLNTIPRWSSA